MINPKNKKNVARFVNSSESEEEANCKTSTCFIEIDKEFVLYLYSCRTIEVGEELKYFYGNTYWSNDENK